MMEIKPALFVHRQNVTADTVVSNIRANAGRNLPSLDFKKVCVCGSGPSLPSDIDLIRNRLSKGYSVAAVNGAYKFLHSNGVIANYFFMVDAQPDINLAFLDCAELSTRFFIASQCDPQIFSRLRWHDVTLWQVGNSSYDGAAEAIREEAPGAVIFGGACNVGQSCLFALMALGYRRMDLFGFDGPTRSGERYAFRQPQNDRYEDRDWFFQGQHFVGPNTSAHDTMEFPNVVRALRKHGVSVNVSGDNLLPTVLKAAEKRDIGIEQMEDIPIAAARTRRVEKLPFVLMKWKGHIPYYADDVNRLARQIDKYVNIPHEIVCVTDDPEGIDGGVKVVPMWTDGFERGMDWHRIKLFSHETLELIGPNFVSMDLDTILLDNVDDLFATDGKLNGPFKCICDPIRPYQYCTAMFQLDACAYPHVWSQFSRDKALQLRNSGQYNGFDQAWISYALPNQPTWGKRDGVLSFRVHLAGVNDTLPEHIKRPEGARLIHFHGKWNPRDVDVQAAAPWLADATV
jgi:hypothetical protein